MQSLIQSIQNDRDRALIATLYWAGRRISEVLNLTLKDVTQKRTVGGEVIYLVSFRILKKRKIRLTVDTPFPSKEYIPAQFCFWYEKLLKMGKSKEVHIFAISPQRAWQICKEKISKDIHPHWFRHNRASHLGTQMNEIELMAYFGWSSFSTARKYIHSNPDVVLEKMRKLE